MQRICVALPGLELNGKIGKIVQIAGPQEEKQEDIWNGPNRKVPLRNL